MSGELRVDHPAPHVARLTFSNRAKRNALDHAILDAIAATVRELEEARCLLITASGPVFSAGYDIGGLPRDEFAHQAEALVAHPFHDAIGAARTRELFFTARNISAQRAERWGLVSEVVPADELAARAVEYAGEIAALAPLSQRGNKRVIGELLAAEGALDPDTERELVELREACFRSDDFYEGVQAFAEKREPRWRAQ